MKTIFLITLYLLFASCNNSTNLLKNKKIDSGNWLLVNHNYADGTLKIIDDETILIANPNGIEVNWKEDHMFTTCDGVLSLYKDGELIEKRNYLSQSYIHENKSILKAYKNAEETTIVSSSKSEYQRQWDSIKSLAKHYPTRYYVQPENKDVIRFFRYD